MSEYQPIGAPHSCCQSRDEDFWHRYKGTPGTVGDLMLWSRNDKELEGFHETTQGAKILGIPSARVWCEPVGP
jgi:hypothetical protein